MEYLCLSSTNSEDSSYPEQLLSGRLQFNHTQQQYYLLYFYYYRAKKCVSQP